MVPVLRLKETNWERSWKYAVVLELTHLGEILAPIPRHMLRGQQSLQVSPTALTLIPWGLSGPRLLERVSLGL